MVSDSHISQQTLDKFNRVNSVMIENGVFKFFDMFLAFSAQIWNMTEEELEDEEIVHPISADEFQLIVALFLAYNGIAIFVLICETIWFRIRLFCRRSFNRLREKICRKVIKFFTK